MSDSKTFCVNSLVVLGVLASIPAVLSALAALLYCFVLWHSRQYETYELFICLSWIAFVGIGIWLVINWKRFGRKREVDHRELWLWVISTGYCGIISLAGLACGYCLYNAERFDLRDWHGDRLDPDLYVPVLMFSSVPLYAVILCALLVSLSRRRHPES